MPLIWGRENKRLASHVDSQTRKAPLRTGRGIPRWARTLAGIAALASLLAAIVIGSGLLNRGTGNAPAKGEPSLPPDRRLAEALLGAKWQEAESASRELLARDPFDARAIFNLAYSLQRQGRLDEATGYYLLSADFREFGIYSKYNLACIHSVQESPDEAIELLRAVIEEGFVSTLGIASEHDFDLLRADPEFHRLVLLEEVNRDRKSGIR